jgi:hypothetical protein
VVSSSPARRPGRALPLLLVFSLVLFVNTEM